MFSLKRISKIFLSALCMLSCVCGLSFVSAQKGVDFILKNTRNGHIIYLGRKLGIGKWRMAKNKGKGKTVSSCVEFVERVDGQITAHELAGSKRVWWIKYNSSNGTASLFEKVPGCRLARLIQTFYRDVRKDTGGTAVTLRLSDDLDIRGAIDSTGEGLGFGCVNDAETYSFESGNDAPWDGRKIPNSVRILMMCFLPEGPLNYVSRSW